MKDNGLSRRDVLAAAGAGMVATAILPSLAQAAPQDADELTKKLIGNAAVKEGRVTLKLAEAADSAGAEPISVSVDSPMTAADHVKALHIISEGNPNPGVSSWFFTPRSGKAEVAFRMRLGKTQIIRAYAVMSDGQVFGAKREIKVTIGGC